MQPACPTMVLLEYIFQFNDFKLHLFILVDGYDDNAFFFSGQKAKNIRKTMRTAEEEEEEDQTKCCHWLQVFVS